MEHNKTKFEKLWQEYEDEFWKETNKNLNNFLNHITNVKKDKNCNLNNNAPKSIKGDYDLSIHGNKIVLVDNADGTTVEAKCHPDDNFDIGAGIKEAFKKLNEKREEIRKQKEEEEEKKIKVGDWVKVVNSGASYTTHTDFFVRNNIPIQYCVNYCYSSNLSNGDVGKVLFIAENKAVIQSTVTDCCDFAFDDAIYLVGLSGLKKVAKPRA